MKPVIKVVWEVKCEEFCPLLPGCPCEGCKCGGCQGACGGQSGQGCAEGACCGHCQKSCDPCAVEREKNYVTPTCGKPRCKKTLIKKEVVCMVPHYKCVVEYCCQSCGSSSIPTEKAVPSPAPALKALPAPPAPKTTASAPLPPTIVGS